MKDINIADSGRKDDYTKLRWDLLPIDAIEQIVEVYTYGANKYADNNWQKVENAKERYYAALMRHLAAYGQGEIIDAESGKSHISMVAWNAITLLWFEMHDEVGL